MIAGPSPLRVTTATSFCLVANLVPLMAFPAVLPQVSQIWQLSAAEAGWVGAVYFAGYAIAVPFLARATDRMDGRQIVMAASLLGAAAGLAFFFLAHGFWIALATRFASGMALAGIHMPGLKLLIERTEGAAQARSAALYTSSYAIGSSGSFLVAGLVEMLFGWRAVFLAASAGPLLAAAVVLSLGPPLSSSIRPAVAPSFASVVRNRPFMAYVVGFAGNTWESLWHPRVVRRMSVVDVEPAWQRHRAAQSRRARRACIVGRRASQHRHCRAGAALAAADCHRLHLPPVGRSVPDAGGDCRR